MASSEGNQKGELSQEEQRKLAKGNLSGLMSKVDEVKGKMTENFDKMAERGEKLHELQDHSEAMTLSAAKLANKVDAMKK